MNQGMRGIGLFLTGWILALTTYYLGALDTGLWIPLVVTGIEMIGLVLMIAGIWQISDLHRNYKTAKIIAVLALGFCLAMGIVQIISLDEITIYLAIAAVCFTVTKDVLFMVLTGLLFLGMSDRLRKDGGEKDANRLDYLWAVFLTFAVLYFIIQAVAVLLVNEGLAALTYIVPAAGLPLLIVGILLIFRVYRTHSVTCQAAD